MKICIVKTSALGDIVQTYPVLSYLRDRFPDACIDWVVEVGNVELVATHPYVTQAIPIDLKRWRQQPHSWSRLAEIRNALQTQHYDVVFDIQGNIKSGLLTYLTRGRHKVGFGWSSAAEWPNALFTNRRYSPPPGGNIRDDYLQLVQSYFGDRRPFVAKGVALAISDFQRRQVQELLANTRGPKVLVCPGSAWPNKQLPVDTLEALLRKIQPTIGCHYLFCWGSESEREASSRLHTAFKEHSTLVERLSLPSLQNLMGGVDLVVAMDSLPLQLAATAGAATFGLFGPSLAAKYNPPGSSHGAFQGPCPYGRTFDKRCPILRTCPTGACLRDQPADTLFKTFMSWYKPRRG